MFLKQRHTTQRDMSKTIIFDFDGTIADTMDTIIKIYNSIAPKYRCNTVHYNDIEPLRGKTTQDVIRACNINFFKLPFVINRVKRTLKKSIYDIKPIKGIKKAIFDLKDAGYNMGIMTSNNTDNVKLFLKNNNLSNLIDFTYSGKDLFGKDRVMQQLIKERFLSAYDIIYVGDETRDIEAMKQINIPVVAVTWGFNSYDILKKRQPDVIVESPGELHKAIEQIASR